MRQIPIKQGSKIGPVHLHQTGEPKSNGSEAARKNKVFLATRVDPETLLIEHAQSNLTSE